MLLSATSRCLFSDKYKTHKYSVGRTYNCWMLSCWCITWPVGFKRLRNLIILEYNIICTSDILHNVFTRSLTMLRVWYRNMKLNNWSKLTVAFKTNSGCVCVSNENALSFTAAGRDEVFILPPSWSHGEGDDNQRTGLTDLYLTTHNTHTKQPSMPPVGFEPAISASERPQTSALERTATGTGIQTNNVNKLRKESWFTVDTCRWEWVACSVHRHISP